ncbi:MAG: CPBP family intramembrane metalloprotease [Actinomycetota bacterium]|nr:CPBP family intramembrane metalloprotease [Actinomycetota bacterium]
MAAVPRRCLRPAQSRVRDAGHRAYRSEPRSIARRSRLSGDVGDLLIPVAGIVAFGLATFGIAFSRYRHLIADRRVHGLKGAALAYHSLLRIPLGTALAEELLFRGALFAAWRAAGASTVTAALCAAVSFGLWHISPTAILVSINDPMASARKLRMTIASAVIFTTIAGLGLTWLRLETDGLVAPIVLHAGVNSVGALGAVVAGRRVDAQAVAPAQFRP